MLRPHAKPPSHPTLRDERSERAAQVYDLERNGGSIFGGVIKLLQERRKNPPPPRDPKLPPKPKGQTVGSFRKGLQSLPEAMALKMKDNIRCAGLVSILSRSCSMS